jgi:hypothetical protein
LQGVTFQCHGVLTFANTLTDELSGSFEAAQRPFQPYKRLELNCREKFPGQHRQKATRHARAALIGVIFSFVVSAAAAVAEIHARFYYGEEPLLTIGSYTFDGGETLNLTVGIGSAAFHRATDPHNTVWVLSDRGPNIACGDMESIARADFPACSEVKNGRVYPMPSFTPSIYRVRLIEDGTFRVTDVITLKDRDGCPLSGLPNPLKTAVTEFGLDGRGKHLSSDLNGFDPEGLIILSDGTFWIGESVTKKS